MMNSTSSFRCSRIAFLRILFTLVLLHAPFAVAQIDCDYNCFWGRCSPSGSCYCGGDYCDLEAGEVCGRIQGYPKCFNSNSHPANCGFVDLECGDGETCLNAECVKACPAPNIYCGAVCVNPLHDNRNCGACGNACPTGQACIEGSCECPPGQNSCKAGCTDLETDEQNCGSCGNACPSQQACVAGRCQCPAGQTLCSGTCVDLTADNKNCGDCGNICSASEQCLADSRGSSCQLVCASNQTNCGGVCVDLSTDNQNCGACGVGCPPGRICDGSGQCVVTCLPGQTFCDGECVNLDTSNQHCGVCGNECGPGEVCNGVGQCRATCLPGQTLCNGQCVDLGKSNLNCGSCGNSCEAGKVCDGSGSCVLTCTEGQVTCDGSCISLESDRLNCGACGTVCEVNERCLDGRCSETGFLESKASSTVYLPYWSLLDAESELTVHAESQGSVLIRFYDRSGLQQRSLEMEFEAGETWTLDLRDPSIDLSDFGYGSAVITPVSGNPLLTAQFTTYETLNKRVVQLQHVPALEGLWTRFDDSLTGNLGSLAGDTLYVFCPANELAQALLSSSGLPGDPQETFSDAVRLVLVDEDGQELLDVTRACDSVSVFKLADFFSEQDRLNKAGSLRITPEWVFSPVAGSKPEDSAFLAFQVNYSNPLTNRARAKRRIYSGSYLFSTAD